jgi:HSP20 family protein
MTLVKNNYRNLDNLLDEFFKPTFPAMGRDSNWSIPAVNIHENNEAFHLELLAPGLNKEDFKVNLEKGLLTISYEHKTEADNKDYKTHRREFSYSSFKRSFNLDEKNINADAIQAKYENGVLKLYLPKKEEVKVMPKQITIE